MTSSRSHQASVAGASLVVFAAGKGTRLLPLTSRVPKAMVPILDLPLVDLALARTEGLGWRERFVNVSGPSPLLRRHLEEAHADVSVFDEGGEGIGTAATLQCLAPQLGEPVVTYNCDLVSDLPVEQMLSHHRASDKPCTLAVKPVSDHADIDLVDGHLRLVDRRHERRSGFLFLGAACFDRSLMGAIPPTRPLGLVEGLLRHAFAEGLVELFDHVGYARDAGSLQRYLEVSRDALRGKPPGPKPPGSISPDGWYLGPGAVAHPESLGDGAIVLSGSRVEPGAKVGNCVVWPGSLVPAGAEASEGVWFDDRLLPANR